MCIYLKLLTENLKGALPSTGRSHDKLVTATVSWPSQTQSLMCNVQCPFTFAVCEVGAFQIQG